MSSLKTEKHGNESSQFVRNIKNSAFQKYSIDTTMSTLLQTTVKPTICLHEGDTLILTCSGNIGKPPGKLVWQKFYPQQNAKRSIIHSNETIEELPDKCSFKSTTNLTVLISAKDLNAQFRCFEESQADFADMYIETAPLNVHCEYYICLQDIYLNNSKQIKNYRHVSSNRIV